MSAFITVIITLLLFALVSFALIDCIITDAGFRWIFHQLITCLLWSLYYSDWIDGYLYHIKCMSSWWQRCSDANCYIQSLGDYCPLSRCTAACLHWPAPPCWMRCTTLLDANTQLTVREHFSGFSGICTYKYLMYEVMCALAVDCRYETRVLMRYVAAIAVRRCKCKSPKLLTLRIRNHTLIFFKMHVTAVMYKTSPLAHHKILVFLLFSYFATFLHRLNIIYNNQTRVSLPVCAHGWYIGYTS